MLNTDPGMELEAVVARLNGETLLAALRARPELESVMRGALSSLDAERKPPLPHVPGLRSKVRARILRALHQAPRTLDELHTLMPDVQRTALISSLHEFKLRGVVGVEPTRYALNVEAEAPLTVRAGNLARKARVRGRPLDANDLAPSILARLGCESDAALAKEAGVDRLRLRALRVALGIHAAARSGARARGPASSENGRGR